MTVTATETVGDLVTDALLYIEAATLGQSPEAAEMALGIRTLNRMMKAWQMRGYSRFFNTSTSLALTTAASYTMTIVRPINIRSARLKINDIETPMFEMTQNEYDELPNKASTGLPTQFLYDRQREAALLYVWPLLASASGETIEMTIEREYEDVTSSTEIIDIPVEGYEAVVFNLGSRLSHVFGNADRRQLIHMEAREKLDDFLAGDVEGSVFFRGGDYA